jgi:hypothetical protein
VGRELRSLAGDAPPAIDVRARVMARVATLGPPRREEVRTRAWAWSSTAALAAAAGLAGALWTLLPELGRTVHGAWIALSGVGPAAGALAGAIGGSIASALHGLADLATTARAAAGAARVSPALGIALAAGMAAMISTVSIVVARDLRRPAGARRKEPTP